MMKLRLIIAGITLMTCLVLAAFHVDGWTQSIGTLAAGFLMGTFTSGAGTASPTSASSKPPS